MKLSGLLHGLILRPGNRIAIQIDKPGLIGEDYVLDIRPDKRPKIQVSSP